jgi:hypothetical protein
MKKEMDLYSDYLLSSFEHVTATGLSEVLDKAIFHDKITRLLSRNDFNSMSLRHEVKPSVREYESEEASQIFDDTIVSKPYTDENDLISWHRDHSKGRNEKGIHLLTAFYHTQRTANSEVLRVLIAIECIQ